ncbi:hypothetical protein ACFOHY_19845 [Rhizobium rosettiformans]
MDFYAVLPRSGARMHGGGGVFTAATGGTKLRSDGHAGSGRKGWLRQ